MKLETDINRIRGLAEIRADENWQFRAFLKGCDLSDKKLDNIVHGHYRSLAEKIDCCICGNCCREAVPVLSRTDVRRLASHLAITQKAFIDEYLSREKDPEKFAFRSIPCPFLEDNRCKVYDARPNACRSYPHLHKKDFVFRLINVVNNCSICPIVFHLMETLKAELWHRGRDL